MTNAYIWDGKIWRVNPELGPKCWLEPMVERRERSIKNLESDIESLRRHIDRLEIWLGGIFIMILIPIVAMMVGK